MNKDSIIHFIGFITRLEHEEFAKQWRQYSRELAANAGNVSLQESADGAGKYKFISQHQFDEQDFRFSFMKNRTSANFPDQKARMVLLGGYTLLDTSVPAAKEKNSNKMLAFLGQDIFDLDFFRNLAGPGQLNIYQPFYENCVYGYILEFFFTDGEKKEEALQLLKKREGVEVAVYRNCKAGLATH